MKKFIPILFIVAGLGLFYVVQAQTGTTCTAKAVNTIEASAELPVDPKKSCEKKCTAEQKAACAKAQTAEASTQVAGAKDVATKKTCTAEQKAACAKAQTGEATTQVAGAKEKATCKGYKATEAKIEDQ